MQNLIDLDELALKCRNEKSKNYIKEALICYKNGAYRSAIISTWLAIVFDFINKLEELENTGDQNAKTKLDQYKLICENIDTNLSSALNFEKNILTMSMNEFSLITPLEKIELERIYEDRNRCAHPSYISIDQPYNPTAELARTHIRNAIEIMLMQPPVQGKAVIEKILDQISSEYFPDSQEEAKIRLQEGYLKRAKESVIRNLAVCLVKGIFLEDSEKTKKQRSIASIKALNSLYPQIINETLIEKINSIIAQIPDEYINNVLLLIDLADISWQLLNNSSKNKLKIYFNSVTDKEVLSKILFFSLKQEELKAFAQEKISTLESETLELVIKGYPCEELCDRAIYIFSNSGSFRYAEQFCKNLINPLVKIMSVENLRNIVKAIPLNRQIYQANGIEKHLQFIFQNTETSRSELKFDWEELYAFLTNEWKHYIDSYQDLLTYMRSELDEFYELPDS